MVIVGLPSRAAGQSALGTIRDDVRTPPAPDPPSAGPPPSSPAESSRRDRSDSCHHDGTDSVDPLSSLTGAVVLGGLYLTGAAITSPVWGPHVLLQDDFSVHAYYARFPYDGTTGYLLSQSWPSRDAQPERLGASDLATGPPPEVCLTPEGWSHCRNWSLQLRGEYQDQTDRLNAVGGQMLLEATSRLGLDISFQTLRERLAPEQFDHLSLGDANVTFRFAQHPRAQMRIGLGMNWMADTRQHDLGFNFTYGGDFFPVRPWIVSAGIDWGTLGHAELFRFRTTLGVIVNRFEPYVGYEYLDIDRTHANALLAGVRLWF